MNNKELQEQLEDFGDHLDVAIVVTDQAGVEKVYTDIEVDTDNNGEIRVALAVED